MKHIFLLLILMSTSKVFADYNYCMDAYSYGGGGDEILETFCISKHPVHKQVFVTTTQAVPGIIHSCRVIAGLDTDKRNRSSIKKYQFRVSFLKHDRPDSVSVVNTFDSHNINEGVLIYREAYLFKRTPATTEEKYLKAVMSWQECS